MTKPHAIYRAFSCDGRLLYVGASASPMMRIQQHCGFKAWATDIATVTVQWFASKADALAAEQSAICAERPEWNVVHKSGAKRARGIFDHDFKRSDRRTWVSDGVSQ